MSIENTIKQNIVFPWNKNIYLEEIYKEKNYKIIRTNSRNKNAIIFFSGNGLYYPNEEKVFEEIIVKNNYYEWGNVAKNRKIRKKYSLIIFVRDIYKQWYLDGINAKLNTQEKVIEELAQITKDYKITTCGNSAGGYMAVLAGILLNAENIYTFSGQFFIDCSVYNGPIVEQNMKTEKNKYYSLVNILSNHNSNIFFFYPGKSQEDISQYNLIKDFNIYSFCFDTGNHGETTEGCCYRYILTCPTDYLKKLNTKFNDQQISKKLFTKEIFKNFSYFKYLKLRYKEILKIRGKND